MTHNAPVSHAAGLWSGQMVLAKAHLLYPTLPHSALHWTTQQIIWNGICSNSQKKQTRSIGQLLLLHLPHGYNWYCSQTLTSRHWIWQSIITPVDDYDLHRTVQLIIDNDNYWGLHVAARHDGSEPDTGWCSVEAPTIMWRYPYNGSAQSRTRKTLE